MKAIRTFTVHVLVNGKARRAYRGYSERAAGRVLEHLLICGEDAWMTVTAERIELEAVYA